MIAVGVVLATAALSVAAGAAFLSMRFERILPTLRQDDDAMTVAGHRHGANETLLAEVPKVTGAWVTTPAVVVLLAAR